jgi:hypothetical protein
MKSNATLSQIRSFRTESDSPKIKTEQRTGTSALSKQFGRGFGKITLWRMCAFFQAWPDKQILSTPLKESGPSTALYTFADQPFGEPPKLAHDHVKLLNLRVGFVFLRRRS